MRLHVSFGSLTKALLLAALLAGVSHTGVLADQVVKGCTIVANPTPDHRTDCPQLNP